MERECAQTSEKKARGTICAIGETHGHLLRIPLKFALIPQPRRELFAIRRRDVIHGKRATAATKITPRTVGYLFARVVDQEKRHLEAKGLAYRDEAGYFHVRFWNEGDNQDRDVHHQDALADLLYAEAEGLWRQALRRKNESYKMQSLERAQLALALNSVRQNPSVVYPADILRNAQGFKFTRARDGGIVAFDIDSGITRAQIKRGVVVDGRLLSEMLARVHAAISPELREYRHIGVRNLPCLRIEGKVPVPEGLRLVDLE